MDFDLSEEQSILKDSLGRLLADAYGFEARARFMASPEGWSAEMWERYAGMGLTALPFEEEHGGVGAGPVETMIVMEAFGSALALEPYLSTVVVGGGFLRDGAADPLRADLLPRVADGSLKLAFAHTERHARYDLHHVETRLRKDGDGYVLSGEKGVVLDGDGADRLFVTARMKGDARDETGIALALVDAGAKGVSRRGHATQDGRRAAEITFEDVRVAPRDLVGEPGDALPLVRRVVDRAIAALAAEAVGVMSAMHRLTLEHLKVRQQFGVPIGTFQALQHMAVDMYVETEQARSLALFATMMAEEEDAQERSRAMHAVKAGIGRAGRLVGEHAIQLHGGVGMTMEHAVGHYFKRMAMIDVTFGDADHHLRSLAAAGGLFTER